MPHLGKNAIAAGAKIVAAFEAEQARLQIPSTPPYFLGQPQLTVSLIEGGRGLNIVPDFCRVSIDRRLVDGEQVAATVAELTALAERSCPLPVAAQFIVGEPAFLQPPNSPWIQQLAAWSGAAPQTVPYGTNTFAYLGIAREMVVMGPGSIEQAHGIVEWVAVSELEKMAAIYCRRWGVV
jgi:acetylornithine deacetylase/succinyl-diaminopimelate desuccinylase-like protein